jgi:thiol-disulfide isomerase/thioredoxin
MRRALALLAVLVSLPVAAQGAGVPFAAAYGTPGAPDFPPITRALADPLMVSVPLPDTSQALAIVWGEHEGETVVAVFHRRPDEASYVPFRPKSDGVAAQTVDLELTLGSETQTPLEVHVIPDRGLAMYRWALSETAAAGGVPTAAPNPLALGTTPALRVRHLDGAEASLTDYRDRVVVLNWWSVTCSPCVAEMPSLNRLAEAYGDRVTFLAVSWDTAEDVDRLLARFPFDYTQTLGDDTATALFGETFPRHVVLDREGRVVYDTTGGSEDIGDELAPEIEAALAG